MALELIFEDIYLLLLLMLPPLQPLQVEIPKRQLAAQLTI